MNKKDILIFTGYVELLTDPTFTNFDSLERCQENIKQLHKTAQEFRKAVAESEG
jgi:hypothetical protein